MGYEKKENKEVRKGGARMKERERVQKNAGKL